MMGLQQCPFAKLSQFMMRFPDANWRQIAASLMKAGKQPNGAYMRRSHQNLFDEMRRDSVYARTRCRLIQGIFLLRKSAILPRDVGFIIVKMMYDMRYDDCWMRKQMYARSIEEDKIPPPPLKQINKIF